jgi:GT2 family glycosyltransferase
VAPFSIVIVTHDSATELARLLDSVERQLAPRPEVIVVDTQSTDATAAVASGRARLVELDSNPGFGAANNAGVAQASSEVTVLLNPDVELLDADLATLAHLAAGRRALLVPRLLNSDGSVQRSAHPAPGRLTGLLPGLIHPRLLPRPLRLIADPWRADSPRTVGWAIAACVAAPTMVLRELGPFDAAQFLFFEDLDLCLRAAAAGVPTRLLPGIAVVHAGGHSTGPAYGGEPHELLARRRRAVVGARLGARALFLDDLAQATTFATRIVARAAAGRDRSRERAQLAALRAARRPPRSGGPDVVVRSS